MAAVAVVMTMTAVAAILPLVWPRIKRWQLDHAALINEVRTRLPDSVLYKERVAAEKAQPPAAAGDAPAAAQSTSTPENADAGAGAPPPSRLGGLLHALLVRRGWSAVAASGLLDDFSAMHWWFSLPAAAVSVAQGVIDMVRANALGAIHDSILAASVAAVAAAATAAAGPAPSPTQPTPPSPSVADVLARASVAGAGVDLSPIWTATWTWAIMMVADWGANILTGHLFALARWTLVMQARSGYFRQLLRQDIAWHEQQHTSTLLARLNGDTDATHDIVHHTPERLVRGLVSLVLGATFMLRVDWQLSVVAILARLPLIYNLPGQAWRYIDAYWHLQQDALRAADRIAAEAFANVKTVHAAAATRSEGDRYEAQMRRYLHGIRVSNLAETALRYTTLMLQFAAEVAMLVFAVHRVVGGHMTMGQYAAFKIHLAAAYGGWEGLQGLANGLHAAATRSEGYYRWRKRRPVVPLDEPAAARSAPLPHTDSVSGPTVGDTAAPAVERPLAEPLVIAHPRTLRGHIQFVDVHFAYGAPSPPAPAGGRSGADTGVLRGVSFTVPAGSTLGLAGASGVGKSTICKLLLRFYDVHRGAVLIDGVDVRRYDIASLRRCMGYVDQDTACFDRSVRDNLTLGLTLGVTGDAAAAAAARGGTAGDSTASPIAASIDVACRRAHFDAIVASSLPQGLDTLLGERGVKLSVGMRQRLAIARAFLRSPRVLLLDEFSASLDAASESAVAAGLEELVTGRTVLIVAHRLRTLQRANCICVLVNGRVAEQGTHAELVAAGGEYARLVEHQRLDR